DEDLEARILAEDQRNQTRQVLPFVVGRDDDQPALSVLRHHSAPSALMAATGRRGNRGMIASGSSSATVNQTRESTAVTRAAVGGRNWPSRSPMTSSRAPRPAGARMNR